MNTVDSGVLTREIQTYEHNKEKLLSEHRGEFVIIKDDSIIKTFESFGDAYRHGIETFGNQVPFLLRQITDLDPSFRLKGVNVPWLVSQSTAHQMGG